MSIFLKDCPQCAGSNPSDALFCHCGYCYDPSQVRCHDDALIHVVNEEQNYLDYLSARVTQVQAELEAKLAAQVLAPGNTTLAADVLLARQALGSTRAELRLQSEKVESLNRQRKTVRRKFRPSMPAIKPLNGRAKAAKPPVAAPPIVVAAKPAPAPVLRVVAQAPKPNTPPKATTLPVAARSGRAIKPAAPAVQALPARPVEAAPASHQPVARKPATVQPKVSDAPSAAFHAVQAARAEKVVTRQPPELVAAPVPSLTPASDIREAPRMMASIATALPEIPANTQECPNCMARLPAGAGKCRCGFDLTSRFEMPALSLSAADRALLLSKLDYGS